MTTAYEIPTQARATQQQIVLNGTLYQLSLYWCAAAGAGTWMLDIADQNGNDIACGLPLITGADLLAQLEYLGIGDGGALIVQSDNDPDVVPTFTSLGSTGHLYFVSPN